MFGKTGRLVGIVLAGALAVTSQAHAAKVVVGKPAPDFEVTTFDGKKLSLADFKGQVLVVNLWATWCAPCRVELPLLDNYYRIQGHYGLKVVALTTEDSVPSSFLKPLTKVLAFPLAHKFRGAGYFQSRLVPMNYVIDRSGVVRYAQAGAFTLDRLNQVLIPLLEEPPPEDKPPLSTAAAIPPG